MVMVQNIRFFDTAIDLVENNLDVEGNNILHYLLYNIDNMTADKKDIQARL